VRARSAPISCILTGLRRIAFVYKPVTRRERDFIVKQIIIHKLDLPDEVKRVKNELMTSKLGRDKYKPQHPMLEFFQFTLQKISAFSNMLSVRSQ